MSLSGFNIPKIEIPRFEVPRLPELPELTVVKLSVQEVKSLSDEQLLAYLNGEEGEGDILPLPLQQLIASELLRRNLERSSKPHWSVLPSFWLLVLSIALAAAALIVSILALPQVQKKISTEAEEKSIHSETIGTRKVLSQMPASASMLPIPSSSSSPHVGK